MGRQEEEGEEEWGRWKVEGGREGRKGPPLQCLTGNIGNSYDTDSHRQFSHYCKESLPKVRPFGRSKKQVG